MISAVLLDAGGVLLLPDPNAMREGFAAFGVDPDDDACFRAHYVSMREVDRIGWADWPTVDRALAREVGISDDELGEVVPIIDKLYQSVTFVPAPGAIDGLRAIEEAGYALAIVSNATGTMEKQLADHRICAVGADPAECVEVAIVVDSHVVGVEKPDPRIFDFALEALGVSAEQCVFVGDTVALDVRGAEAAGIVPVHMDPYGLCPDADHAHIASVVEVLRTITAIETSSPRAS